jgi:surfactin synthase thioesterase subunit
MIVRAPTTSTWLPLDARPSPASAALFCFPYAGAGASVYAAWVRESPVDVAVRPVQLPGRETRLNEPRYRSWSRLLDAVAQGLSPHLRGSFAFFGHSMGAVIGYELAKRLDETGGPSPAHLFVSGRRAPQCAARVAADQQLRDAKARTATALVESGARAADCSALVSLLLPILRDDFSVCESYHHTPSAPLACPLSVFGGLDDADVPIADLEAWRECTTGRFRLRVLPGDHFFVHSSGSLLRHFICEDLRTL